MNSTQPSIWNRLFLGLDDSSSPIYIIISILFYIVPVSLITILFLDAADRSRYDVAYVALFWVVIVVMPLMLTFGVFWVYRTTYLARHHDNINKSTAKQRQNVTANNGAKMGVTSDQLYESKDEWVEVITKALDWRRFLMPLCLINTFIVFTSGFLLFADISSIPQGFELARNQIVFGIYDMQLYFGTELIIIPGSLFYIGLLGFMVQYLEMTRRRYVSRNIVPRFYVMSTFRLIQAMVIVVIVYFFMLIFVDNQDAYILMVTGFVVGMFPLQILSPVVESVRERLGMSVPKKLSITMINGIDNTLESLLQEENIDSIQVLATANIADIQKRTAIPEKTLINWQKQARLFDVLGTEDLIHRFARMGINDFDDLHVLVDGTRHENITESTFTEDFTNAMKIKSDEESIGSDAYWRVLIQVLIREYKAENPSEDIVVQAEISSIEDNPISKVAEIQG